MTSVSIRFSPVPGKGLPKFGMPFGGLKPVIDRSFSLETITAAFEHFQAHNHFGKITLEIRSLNVRSPE